MALKSQAATRAALDGMNALANGGTLVLYSGAVPGTADAAAGTTIVTINLEATAFSSATGTTTATASLSIGGGKSGTTVAALDPDYYRILSSGAVPVHQGTAGAGGDLDFDVDTGWELGATVTVTSLTVSLPVA